MASKQANSKHDKKFSWHWFERGPGSWKRNREARPRRQPATWQHGPRSRPKWPHFHHWLSGFGVFVCFFRSLCCAHRSFSFAPATARDWFSTETETDRSFRVCYLERLPKFCEQLQRGRAAGGISTLKSHDATTNGPTIAIH